MKLSTWVRLAATVLILSLAVVWTGVRPAMADMKAAYAKNCAKCHGDDGAGKTKMGEKLKVQDWTAAAFKSDKATIEKAIKEGVAKAGDHGKMNGYADKLSDAEVKELVDAVMACKKGNPFK